MIGDTPGIRPAARTDYPLSTAALIVIAACGLLLCSGGCKGSGGKSKGKAAAGERIALAGLSVGVPKGWSRPSEDWLARLRSPITRACGACKVEVVGRKGTDGHIYIMKTVYPRTVTLRLLKASGGRTTAGELLVGMAQGQHDRARQKGATFLDKPRVEKRRRTVLHQSAMRLAKHGNAHELHMRGSYRLGCDGRMVSLGVICLAKSRCGKLLKGVRDPPGSTELLLSAPLPRALLDCLDKKK